MKEKKLKKILEKKIRNVTTKRGFMQRDAQKGFRCNRFNGGRG
jgi:hypothetical protein